MIFTFLSLFTPLIDQAEIVRAGAHFTTYGPLFVLYIIHVMVYLAYSVVTTFKPVPGINAVNKMQLRLVGTGILATALVGVTANIILPFWFADFRFINTGTLSTILLLAALGYAVFAHHLFNIRVIVRRTMIFAVRWKSRRTSLSKQEHSRLVNCRKKVFFLSQIR
uniref:Predicted transmembrane protein n=1 Tax=uncultured bacterium RM44 TaxID=672208 RepID=D3W8M8_9BACT|nr:predicted transmembrane protein [uncultured bacterium RM44]